MGSPDGPIVGRAFPGARLDIDLWLGDAVRVVLTEFPSLVRKDYPDGGEPSFDPAEHALTAYLSTECLTTTPVQSELPEPVGWRAHSHFLRLRTSPSSDPFAATACGELRILSEARANASGIPMVRIAQRRDGIELFGWAEAPLTAIGDSTCHAEQTSLRPATGPNGDPLTCVFRGQEAFDCATVRSAWVPRIPPGHRIVAEGAASLAMEVLARSKALYVRVEQASGSTCERWSIQWDESGDRKRQLSGALVGEKHPVLRGAAMGTLQETYGFLVERWNEPDIADGRRGAMVELTGPSFVEVFSSSSGRGAAGCLDPRIIVGVDEDHIWALQGWRAAYSYDPEFAIPWFRSRRACEQAIRVNPGPAWWTAGTPRLAEQATVRNSLGCL